MCQERNHDSFGFCEVGWTRVHPRSAQQEARASVLTIDTNPPPALTRCATKSPPGLRTSCLNASPKGRDHPRKRQDSNLFPYTSCQCRSMFRETRNAILLHPRSAQYMRARKKQFPMCSLQSLTCLQVQVLPRQGMVGPSSDSRLRLGETLAGASSAVNGRACRWRKPPAGTGQPL